MSANEVVSNNGQQMQVRTNLAKLFPFDKEIKKYTYTNASGDEVTLQAGTVMGVIAATGKVVPLASAAVDGSANPIGVLAQDYTVADATTVTVGVAIRGEVRRDMILLQGADTLSTVISLRRIEERLEDRLIIRGVTSMTNYDNEI